MEFEIRPQHRFSLGLRELWEYRELFYFFSLRDVKVKYKQTVLGIAWAILQPLMLALIFSVIFGKALSKQATVDMPYDVFAFSGLSLWGIFSSGLNNAGNSMVSNANIIRKVYFPRLIIPTSAVITSLFDFLMALLVFFIYAAIRGVAINPVALLCMPAAVLLTAMITLGAGTLLAALNVKYRDFRYIIPFLIQFLLFVTPVIYPYTVVENKFLQMLLKINPMSSALELFRAGINNSGLNPMHIWPGLISSIVLLCIGLVYFRKTEAYFADLA